jgi:hypothetical protein
MGIMSLFENAARNTKAGAKKTKLKANNAVLERRIQKRKKQFGEEAYDAISFLTYRQDFYATNQAWIVTLRPPLITVDREVRALNNKKVKAEEHIKIVELRRESERELIRQNPPANFRERLGNLSKKSQLAGHHAKYNANRGSANIQIRAAKEKFGIDVFPLLSVLFTENNPTEENEDDRERMSWLPDDDPTHPNILKKNLKSLYEGCASDIATLNREIVANKQEMDAMS